LIGTSFSPLVLYIHIYISIETICRTLLTYVMSVCMLNVIEMV